MNSLRAALSDMQLLFWRPKNLRSKLIMLSSFPGPTKTQ